MNLLNILLFTPQGGEEGGGYRSLIFLLLIVVVFYFFFIRPQMKKSKDQKKFREELKKGNKIINVVVVEMDNYYKLIHTGEFTLTKKFKKLIKSRGKKNGF